MEMEFLVSFGFTNAKKLTIIIANFHCMLLLAAALHSLITGMHWRESFNFELSRIL